MDFFPLKERENLLGGSSWGWCRWGRSDFPLFLRIFPFFYAFSSFSAHFSPFSSLFSASPKGQGQTTAIYCKKGEFHSDPVCKDPVQNFPNLVDSGCARSDFYTEDLGRPAEFSKFGPWRVANGAAPYRSAKPPHTPRESARRGAGQKRNGVLAEVLGKVLVLLVPRRDTKRQALFRALPRAPRFWPARLLRKMQSSSLFVGLIF